MPNDIVRADAQALPEARSRAPRPERGREILRAAILVEKAELLLKTGRLLLKAARLSEPELSAIRKGIAACDALLARLNKREART